MRSRAAQMAVAAVLVGVSACATASRTHADNDPSITIPYDPYNYDPDELFAQAQAHCGAYRLRAVYIDETIDPNSVRWRYRHFDCV